MVFSDSDGEEDDEADEGNDGDSLSDEDDSTTNDAKEGDGGENAKALMGTATHPPTSPSKKKQGPDLMVLIRCEKKIKINQKNSREDED